MHVSTSFFNVTPGASWKSAHSASLASLSASVKRGISGERYFLSSLVTKNHCGLLLGPVNRREEWLMSEPVVMDPPVGRL